MTATAEQRQRLAQIRERARAARASRQRAREILDAAKAAGDEDAIAVGELAVQQADLEVETVDALHVQMLSMMDGGGGGGYGLGGDSFLDNPDTVRTLEALGHTTAPIGSVMLGSFMSAKAFAESLRPRAQGDSSMPGLEGQRVQLGGVHRQIYRPLTLLDLIPAGTMTGAVYEYVQETGDLDTGAAETAEGALKPEDNVDFEEMAAPARTIATWQKARRQVLADIEQLQQVLTQRLSYKVRRRLETQILVGDGAGQNLLGLLNQTGLGSVPFDPAEPPSNLIAKGMTTVALSGAVSTGTVLNPVDYEGMLTARTEGSGERLDSAGAFESPADTMWGPPIVVSAAMPAGKALTGNWELATQVLVREGVTVRVSDSDADDFVKNVVTVLVETRVALATWQPKALCVVELQAPVP